MRVVLQAANHGWVDAVYDGGVQAARDDSIARSRWDSSTLDASDLDDFHLRTCLSIARDSPLWKLEAAFKGGPTRLRDTWVLEKLWKRAKEGGMRRFSAVL